MTQQVFSKAALREIDAIWLYIAEDSIDAAEAWLADLERAVDLIVRTPGIGRTRTDLMPYPLQVWPMKEYLIFYRVRGRSVQVSSVTHGARDLPTYFRDR